MSRMLGEILEKDPAWIAEQAGDTRRRYKQVGTFVDEETAGRIRDYINSKSISAAFRYIARMFSFSGNPADALQLFTPFIILMTLAGLILSFPLTPRVKALAAKLPALEGASYIVCLPLLMLCIMSLAAGSFNPFIYYIF